MALFDIHFFDYYCIAFFHDAHDFAGFTLVFALDYYHVVTGFNFHSTSGAKEIIFWNPLSRSSLATGPKTRVPLGCLSAFIITTAFSSNLIDEPSFLLISFLVLTITAFSIAFFLTIPRGVAFLTATVMTSPMLA